MSDWTVSKVPSDWLRSFYLQFLERAIHWRGKSTVKLDGPKANVTMLPVVIEKIKNGLTLQDLLTEAGENEISCLQAIHILVLERKIYFGEKRKSANDYQAKINRYQKLLVSYRNKDAFQILGISQKGRSSEVQRAYAELAKRFHPDVIPPEAPEELKKLCQQIFALIANAHDSISTDAKRALYFEQLSQKEAQRVLELEPMYESAIQDLWSQKYAPAAKKFDELIELKAPMSDLLAYSYWAKVKAGHRLSEKNFFEIPLENRHSPIYLVAKGLYYRSQGNYQKAFESYQNARHLNENVTEIQREIVELMDEANRRGQTAVVNRFLKSRRGKKAA